MTYEAAIAFAPCTTVELLNDPVRSQRPMYDSGGLRLLPTRGEVLADHDDERVIGRCEKLVRLDDNGPWLCAIATLTECPPWLKRGTPASFRFLAPVWDSFGNNIVRRAIVEEVSVLSPGVEPAEPLARVLYVKRQASPAAVGPTSEVGGAGEYQLKPGETWIHGNGQVVRRYFPAKITIR